MDAKEIFKQLTCGAIFTKPIVSKLQQVNHSNIKYSSELNQFLNFQQKTPASTCIKQEIKEEDVSVDSAESIKSEDESDDERKNAKIQILSDSAMPVLISKKKKKVTPEQLKNWETEKV